MGMIFYLMGKSASGKDTIYRLLLERLPFLKRVASYTTRPRRSGEVDGVEYNFVSQQELDIMEREGKLIEERMYQTVHGLWSYGTVDDGQFDLLKNHYLMMGTLESYEQVKKYFGSERVIPLYIHVEDGVRLQRALDREKLQKAPKYQELCRRFLSDSEDFSNENMVRCEIKSVYENCVLEDCMEMITTDIQNFVQKTRRQK